MEEPTVDQAAAQDDSPDADGEGGQVAAAPKPGESSGSDSDDTATEGEQPAAEGEQVPDDPAEVYRIALARYLENDAVGALDIVAKTLEREGIDDKIRDKLERLQRRARGHIKKETSRIQRLKREEGGDAAEAAPAETSSDASDESASDESASDEAASDDDATDEAGDGAAATDEAASDDDAATDEAVSDEAATDEVSDDAATDEASDEGSDDSADEGGADEVATMDESGERAAPVDSSSAVGAPLDQRPRRRPDSQRAPAVRPGGPGAPPRRKQQRPTAQRPPRQRRPGAPAPSGGAPALARELDRMSGQIETMSKAMRGVENHTLKVAEAYQRLSASGKRKEQAYDQLYEELRTYKDNFLLQAQKPLFKDIILLFDGVRRTMRAFEESEEAPTKEKVAESLQHLQDEILEVLYRRDIELIEEHPEMLDIDFQKPIRRIETDDPSEDRKVEQVLREGFRMNDVVLRPQEVVVKRCLKERES